MTHETFQAPELEHLAELLPAFDFQAFIAKGGMGAVYKARQRSLERDVAIKVLPRELGEDAGFRASFEVEAKAMARLNHPNLISVYDFGDVDGMPYIVMEYVDGKSLYHSAWNKQIEPKQAVSIIKGICAGLGHAHENGVIHRDIKPANILLTPKAEPKIGDFGLALAAEHDDSGVLMGTPGYTAPEVIADHSKFDQRADLFAVGVILHELVTGQRPDPEGKTPRKTSGDPKLDAIWKKAVQPNPALRYPTAEAMAKDLDEWAQNAAARAANPLMTGATAVAAPKAPQSAGPPPPQADGTPAPVPEVQISTGSSWGLVRNLLIIAVLVVAIGFTYKLLKETRAKRLVEKERIEREQYEAEKLAAAQRKRAEEEARLAALRERDKPKPKPDGTDKPEPEPVPETPLESLARLQDALFDGKRDEMPIGTTRRGSSDYFVVPEDLSWHQAAAYAERHGGHLAVITSDEDINWFAELLPRDSIAWVGAGRSSGKSWIQIDGSDWPLSKNPGGVGDYAAVDELGLLRARPAKAKFPFIIEWHRDGSNPASLASILQRTRSTLDSPNPVYPPGTKSLDGRHFAIISRPIKRRDAALMAEQSGGILAVPATRNEADWLAEKAVELGEKLSFWIGGSRQGAVWKWDSGEPWEFAKWAEEADPEEGGESLALLTGEGWEDMDPTEKIDGFIIEWSTDATRADESSEEEQMANQEGGNSLEALNSMAATALERIGKERDDKLAANARTFNWDLDVWFRGLNSSDTTNWQPHVDALKALVVDNRVPGPDAFGEGSEIALSPRMGEVCDYGYKKQTEIDLEHESAADRIRDAYIDRVNTAAQEAQTKGQDGLANNLRRAGAAASEDLDVWIESIVSE
ncbi:protein kinase domain-containing protein [Haloferula rosea]|uniref:Protein kinase n=1 Tax=Haloferula rosea TaxID=490093 RepID=A0A934R9I0_9BACT|nr:protein kinase [Haloferula rosea]MBK1826852.1 protein kinase [Haloferula rosea]